METVDIAIVGAGVIGLAIADEIASPQKKIIVLERNNSFGQETSSRNSEVIHGGMYYPAASLKARLCVQGKHLLYELCEKNNIPYKKTGKLIVATQKSEIPDLEKLFKQGEENDINDLAILDEERLRAMEPNVKGIAALYSPSTGIVDTHRLMEFFFRSSKNKGVMVAFNCDVKAIEKSAEGFTIKLKNGKEDMAISSHLFINCAGLDSDLMAAGAGLDIEKCGYRLHYCKGQYFRVSAKNASLVKRLVYPVPRPKGAGLGIHATVDLGAGLRLGPDDEYLKTREKNYEVDLTKRHAFFESVHRFLPFIEEQDLSADTSGIRPKLQGPGDDFRDFVIKEESDNGLPNFIDLIGIESPGFTASLAIARYVNKLIEKRMINTK